MTDRTEHACAHALQLVARVFSQVAGTRAFNRRATTIFPIPAAIEAYVREHDYPVDWLINNAGSAGPGMLEDTGWSAQSEYLELMMISVAQLCHRFIPPVRTRGFGRVINVSSFAGRIAQPAGANYGPAKAYLVALSEELALELRSTGVHVSALCPGFIWYDAETVVREGPTAVERGKAIRVSGRLYRWLDPIAQSVWMRPIIKALAPGR